MRFSNYEKNLDLKEIKKDLQGYTGAKIVFLNGIYSDEFSDISCISEKIKIGELEKFKDEEKGNILDFLSKGESGINGGFFPILNVACISDLFVLSIPPSTIIESPINVIYIGCSEQGVSSFNNRLVIVSGEKSKSTIIEHHIGMRNSEYFENTAISFLTKRNSKLEFFLINQISSKAASINSIHAEMKENSSLIFSAISLGGLFSRINLGIDINGTNCNCKIKGATVAKENQIVDFHSRISHNLPNSNSSQLQKILLTGKAHGIFAGKIQVQHGAGNTGSDQLCKTLLLSPNSRIDALPILEINNEDVKCTHGSTVSDLDKNQVFYLQSRGIPEKDAKKLLTVGFIKEMIMGYPEEIKSKITRQLNYLM